jgi:glycosyltransferase involved in cell wall biosynthesis
MQPLAPRKPCITYLTAGAAGMYCGSCMHDNSLARAMSAEGFPTVLVPTYTPIRSDEKDVTIDQVFFGGINVYLQEKIPLFRFVPRFMDRLLDHPGLIRKVTSRAIETDARLLGGLTVSMLKGRRGHQKKEVKRLVRWLRDELQPEVLILSNVLIGGFVPDLKKALDIPVIVTLQGDDIFLESLQEPWRREAVQLIGELDQAIDGYLVHSNFYADLMATRYRLNRRKMYITPLGIDTTDYVGLLRNREGSPAVNLGYLARLSPDKGLHNLVTAFIRLKQLENFEHVKLQIAGWLGKDHEDYAEHQFRRLEEAGLIREYRYLGSVDRAGKLQMFTELDVLCVPTDYREPKGLYVLEAMASGIPVVQPAHGVFPELIDDLQGGVLYQPGRVDELVASLEKLVCQPGLRQQLGEAGRQNVLKRRNGKAMAESTVAVVKQVLAELHGKS